jgi:uncharacterized delta-60 repeat protein
MTRGAARHRSVLRLEHLERRDTPSSGDLDPSFGSGGKVVSAFPTGPAQAQAVVVDGSGRLLVAGFADVDANPSTESYDFAVVRYNADGSLDSTFGVGGRATVPIGVGHDIGRAVAVDSSGRIVVAGYANNGSNDDFALVRFNPDGTLDTSFGSGGKVTTAIGTYQDQAKGVAIDSSGKIIAAGSAWIDGNDDLALVRYNADGTLDGSFGSGGKVTTNIGAAEVVNAVALDGVGRIVVAGNTYGGGNSRSLVARYTATGAPDPSFGNGGIVTAATTTFDVWNALAIDPAGRIVAAGNVQPNGTDMALARYLPTGVLDTSFGLDGTVITDIGGGSVEFGNGLAVDGVGRIVVAGVTSYGSINRFVLARYRPNGSLDPTFGFEGKVITNFGTSQDQCNAATIDAVGRIVTVGYSWVDGGYKFAVARYLTNDAPELTDAAVLPAILQGTASPPGRKVSSLFNGLFLDPNAGDTLAGIAVVGNPSDAAQGEWQYSTDGATWFNVGPVGDDTAALALSSSTLLRFLPWPLFSGDPAPLVVRALDSTFTGSFTAGPTRRTVDAARNGNDAPISGNTARVLTSVFPNPVSGAWLLPNGDLLVSGTTGDDDIAVSVPADPTKLVVVINGELKGAFDQSAVTGTIVVRGLAGNDRLTVSPLVAKNANLHGDSGDDVLASGGGNDLLDGGSGDDTLAGGPGGDTYRFAGAWGVDTVLEDANGGDDRLDFSAVAAGVTFTTGNTLTAQLQGNQVTGSFIENLTGGAGNDTLVSTGAGTLAILGANAGTLIGALNFSGIENLAGGGEADTFLIGEGGSMAGLISAGGGVNVLSYAAVATPVTVNLATGAASHIGGHSGITGVIGGGAADTLVGENAVNAWAITGPDAGRVGSLTFSGFENLTGGTDRDTFAFAKAGSVSGTVGGGAGTDTLNYAAFTTGVRINLTLGTATGTGGVSGIENVRTGAGNDVLVGNEVGNRLLGGAGRDILIGGLGADDLRGGSGDDMLVGSATIHDDDAAALELLMQEWQRAIAYGTRVRHLLGTLGGGLNGAALLNGAAIQNDSAVDMFSGNQGLDWFLRHAGERTPDRTGTERVTVL